MMADERCCALRELMDGLDRSELTRRVREAYEADTAAAKRRLDWALASTAANTRAWDDYQDALTAAARRLSKRLAILKDEVER